MDIQNFTPNTSSFPKKKNIKPFFAIIIVVAIGTGFGLSRLLPTNSSKSVLDTIASKNITSTENMTSGDQVIVGESYGDTGKTFNDSATGTIVAGGINGEGTHTLQREGKNQNAALTSSVVDLDLFVGHKVEIKGETNTSKKAGWLLDVGVVKVLE